MPRYRISAPLQYWDNSFDTNAKEVMVTNEIEAENDTAAFRQLDILLGDAITKLEGKGFRVRKSWRQANRLD